MDNDEPIERGRWIVRGLTLKLEDLKTICFSFPGVKTVDIDRDIFKMEVTIAIKIHNNDKRTFAQICDELEKWRPVNMVFIVVMDNNAAWMTVLGGAQE